jgi:acetyl-CoA carboxylase biotin carboxyl carrier protein
MPKFQVDKTLIRELGQLLDETNLTEIEVCEGNKSIRVARGNTTVTAAVAAPAMPAAAAAPAPAPADTPADEAGAVPSPMVGTVYLSSQPGADSFIKVGDTVSEGQTLLIVEAMKVMNQIPALRAGTVKRIAVEDGQPVEFGETLVVIG